MYFKIKLFDFGVSNENQKKIELRLDITKEGFGAKPVAQDTYEIEI